MSALIDGAARILPPFTPSSSPEDFSRTIQPAAAEAAGAEAGVEAGVPSAWTQPLFERRLGQADRQADLASDLLNAMMRVEGVYDPRRPDPTSPPVTMQITPGTASMNNVFADRWHTADTDPGISYTVRTLAQAWHMSGSEPCGGFSRHRPSYDLVELTGLTRADCARIDALRGQQDDLMMHRAIVAAPLSVPVFAAPEPGARMSPEAFWAAQKARIDAIRARIDFRRQRRGTTVALTR